MEKTQQMSRFQVRGRDTGRKRSSGVTPILVSCDSPRVVFAGNVRTSSGFDRIIDLIDLIDLIDN